MLTRQQQVCKEQCMVQEASKQADIGHMGAPCKPKSGMLNLLIMNKTTEDASSTTADV